MQYNLNSLNPIDFEGLIQAFSQKLLGNGAIIFGDGPDGGREATFEGRASFPSELESWDGNWLVQAKYKSNGGKDFPWVKAQLIEELDKFHARSKKVTLPDNYLLFTNVTLTPVAATGGRDRASEFERECEEKYRIKHIRILSHDDITAYLDNFRDIAIAYAAFITPGDVLQRLLGFLELSQKRIERLNEEVARFLDFEFNEDSQSKLDHAGKLTAHRVNLEKVFIYLYAT